MSGGWTCYRDGRCVPHGDCVGIYRAQNYPMDGDWHWLHVDSRSSHCTLFAEPVKP